MLRPLSGKNRLGQAWKVDKYTSRRRSEEIHLQYILIDNHRWNSVKVKINDIAPSVIPIIGHHKSNGSHFAVYLVFFIVILNGIIKRII